MKKTTAILLTLTLTLSLLPGCAAGSQKPSLSIAAFAEKSSIPETTQPTVPETTVPETTVPETTQPTVPTTTQPTTPKGYYESVGGHWADSATKLGDVSTYLYLLDMPLNNCKEITVHVSVEMKAGTHCKNWVLWGRVNGVVKKIGEFTLPGGDGDTSVTFKFNPAISFDAIVVTPTVPGGYSWSLGMGVSDIWLES